MFVGHVKRSIVPLSLVNTVETGLPELFSCSFVGEAYSTYQTAICTDFIQSVDVLAILYLVNGIVMVFVFFCACLGCKKFGQVPRKPEQEIRDAAGVAQLGQLQPTSGGRKMVNY